jgi:hypothetical protein
MINHNPEGYRNLLAYQKASELQIFTNSFVLNLPKTKTFFDLADQMSRSGRSGSKNIVEGWKRNTTKEYFTFLGFSIGAVEELKDDAADIVTGVYPGLMGVKGVMSEERVEREVLDKIPFYPLPSLLPPAAELFLRAKELNFLLHKLQKSLDLKMDKDHTKPLNEKIVSRVIEENKADDDFKNYLVSLGMERLENGKYVSKGEKGEEGE